MNASNLGMIFAAVLIVFILADSIRAADIAAVQIERECYNQAIDNAVETALFDEVELDSREKPFFNHDIVLRKFFDGLHINLGIMENPHAKRLCNLFIPVIVFVDWDGISVYSQEKEEMRDSHMPILAEEEGFVYETGQEKIYFTLGAYMKYEKNGAVIEGYYDDRKSELPNDLQWEGWEFDELRRNTIIETIETAVQEYINQYNRIAKNYGISYHFSLPVISQEEWYRTIEEPGMLVFFQGYPFGNRQTGMFNRMAVGAARIKK